MQIKWDGEGMVLLGESGNDKQKKKRAMNVHGNLPTVTPLDVGDTSGWSIHRKLLKEKRRSGNSVFQALWLCIEGNRTKSVRLT